MTFQRVIQGLSLSLFLTALWCAPVALVSVWPPDAFLRMDPIVLLGTLVADRRLAPLMWVAGLILLLSIAVGRFFCAYLCPMGTSIDITDHLLRTRRKRLRRHSTQGQSAKPNPDRLPARRFKYYLLCFILGAGVLGVSLVFIASPLSLVTRFYGLIIYPVIAYLADLGLAVARPAADRMDLTAMAYAVVKVPRYDLQWVTLGILLAIVAGGLRVPRFWCRCLCPSGALLALLAFRPILRRQVSPDCTQCGLCVKACPMGAIGGDSNADACLTNHNECIACLACVRKCPTRAISFADGGESYQGRSDRLPEKLSLGRRQILGAGLSGAASAIIALTGLKSPHAAPGPGSVIHPAMIRPPGAVPENDFLARCIRCGACMQACPTNSLQPLGFAAGLSAFFSPVVTPRRGPCDPGCSACGRVCPTGALPVLAVDERRCAKLGTARIFRQKCLAWELGKKCLICDEVCPFDAIDFRKPPGRPIAVPFVIENKCAGCGYCEHHCPVQAVPAIVVEPMLALRLSNGSYRVAARERGYSLEISKKAGGHSFAHDGPGDNPWSKLDEKGLPPGFTE